VSEQLPVEWMTTHDPETMKVDIDVQAAAASGCRAIQVGYDEATNNISVEAKGNWNK
jgi:hypothetical protein